MCFIYIALLLMSEGSYTI